MSAITRISLEQYDLMIEHGVFDGEHRRRVELIHGEIRDMTPIGPPHEDAVDLLNEWSMRNVRSGKVRVRVQNSIGLSELTSVPEPDIAWVACGSYSDARPSGKNVFLIIEVAKTSLKVDRGVKTELYAAAGINDYWIVNLQELCIEVFRDPHGGRYRSLQTFAGDQEVRPLTFPEVVLRPADIFGEQAGQ